MPLDDLHKRYINDIADRYSLGRALTIFIWLLFFYTFFELDRYEFVSAISEISVAFLFDMKSGFFKEVSLFHVFLSFGATLLIVRFNNLIKSFFFSRLIRIQESKNTEYQTKLKDQLNAKVNLNAEQRQNIDRKLAEEKKAYRRLQGASEVLLSLCIGSLIGHLSFSILDFTFASLMLLGIFYFQWQAFKKYISEIFPCLVALDHGLSLKSPNLSSVIDSL